MAGPILNFKVFTKSPAHSLRAISVVTFPPGFLFLLIHGIVSENVHPAIGIVPLCFSAVFSLFLLANEKQCGCQRSGLSGTPVHLVFDVLLGVGHLTCLILTWIFLGQSRYDECVMFGTYCTWFLITDFLIHLYFTVQQLYEAVVPGANPTPMSCPQCPNKYGPFAGVGQLGVRAGYAPLLDTEGRPNGDSTAEGAV